MGRRVCNVSATRLPRCRLIMAFEPYDYQWEAINSLRIGNILCGEVGTGKTITSLYFYLLYYWKYPLYVITTAKKRDTNDWQNEASMIGIPSIVVDSWNNIEKYDGIEESFFIFDEQKISGYGKWSKNFIKIAKKNKWIILSATPGDVWMDYLSIFIANGFYKNKTDFTSKHVIYDPFVTFPKIKSYINESVLYNLRDSITVVMKGNKKTRRKREYIKCKYAKCLYNMMINFSWNFIKKDYINTATELVQLSRRIVNSSKYRELEAEKIILDTKKIIVFYNYDYELEILEDICNRNKKVYSQWNGHKHQEIPKTNEWVYLVHYVSSEGWNCIETDTILFYSLNYSYRITEQAEGRIDRLNTKYNDLHYKYLVSDSTIDHSIMRAIKNKGKFNETIWAKQYGK